MDQYNVNFLGTQSELEFRRVLIKSLDGCIQIFSTRGFYVKVLKNAFHVFQMEKFSVRKRSSKKLGKQKKKRLKTPKTLK